MVNTVYTQLKYLVITNHKACINKVIGPRLTRPQTNLLGEVLEVALGESDIGGDNELRLGPLDGNVGAEVSGFAVDLIEA